ncbi:MAG: hypothetical protein H6566_29595 [Lewinellaceae bacterium]|nr:hypothetical protein [Lewinellaceae bacterium]
MVNRYQIEAATIASGITDDAPITLELRRGDRLIRQASDEGEFGVLTDNNTIWEEIKNGLKFIFAPIQKPQGITNFAFFALFVYFLAIIRKVLFFIPIPIRAPFLRGWRFEVVRRIALNKKTAVPGLRPDLVFKYFLKGLVLMFMRYIYFIPLIIVAFLSGMKMLNLIKEVAFYLWDVYQGADSMGIGKFIAVKVIPQAGVEIVIQLVLLGFYVVFVWPIYRIIMIQYALNLTNGFGFLDIQVIKKSIKIFREHASKVYGIYGFVVALDVFVSWFATIVTLFTFGLFWLIAPIYYLILRYWIKGFAYGILGRRLIEAGALEPKDDHQQLNLIDSSID